jgi:CheY-like chemotaxis protein
MAKPYTVLVVDDEPPIRRFLRSGLGAADYRVVEAGDAAEALCAIVTEKVYTRAPAFAGGAGTPAPGPTPWAGRRGRGAAAVEAEAGAIERPRWGKAVEHPHRDPRNLLLSGLPQLPSLGSAQISTLAGLGFVWLNLTSRLLGWEPQRC